MQTRLSTYLSFPAGVILFFWLMGCTNRKSEEDAFTRCLYEAPSPVFADDLAGVAGHHFKLESQSAVEFLAFEDGLELTVLQSGCDQIRQEYRFSIPSGQADGHEGNEKEWVAEVIRLLQRLARMGPEYLSFHSWARAIADNADHIRLREPAELSTGFFAQIEVSHTQGHAILTLILFEKN